MKCRIELTAVCRNDELARLAILLELDALPDIDQPIDLPELAPFQRYAPVPKTPLVAEVRQLNNPAYEATVATTPFLFSGTQQQLMAALKGGHRVWTMRVVPADFARALAECDRQRSAD